MRYLTHQFAHSETLDRARRWLVHAGVSPDRMYIHKSGIPRLAVAAEPAEVQSIEMIIRIAEMNDPDGQLGYWDLARVHPEVPDGLTQTALLAAPASQPSFTLAWQDLDAPRDQELRDQIELQKDYRAIRP